VFENIALTLTGRMVVLEPLRREHGPGLRQAAGDMDWSLMPVDPVAADGLFEQWLDDALDAAASGEHVPFAIVSQGQPIGSTRYLSLRPEHRGLEIGWTWLTRSAWSSGANVEAKLLLLEHAFERLGCIRVEFKTDAKNERSRRALSALPAQFEGVFRKHMLAGNDSARLRDSAWYAIVDDDWPAVKANLERRLRERT
jgi:RimJ/RimL family protein N-acetyltransferase